MYITPLEKFRLIGNYNIYLLKSKRIFRIFRRISTKNFSLSEFPYSLFVFIRKEN